MSEETKKPPADYQVSIETFAGPMDLLLFLIQKNEVDIFDIPIATITEQYLSFMGQLEGIDIGRAGEFLVLAATLIDIKTRTLLPPVESDEDEELLEDDPRQDLVKQLLEYRQIKVAALDLEERAGAFDGRFTTGRINQNQVKLDALEQASEEDQLDGLELGDLLGAFAKVLRETLSGQVGLLELDDIPVEVYVDRIRQRLATDRMVAFRDLFKSEGQRVDIIGTFLAILEMIRLREVRADQQEDFGEIYIYRVGEEQDG